MAMEYYDSINAFEVYQYYLDKNKQMLTNNDVLKLLDSIHNESNENLKSVLFVDNNNFKINEKIVYDDMDEYDESIGLPDSKSNRSTSVINKKTENVSLYIYIYWVDTFYNI